MSFADNLKQIRKDKNLSQEQLAELLDVSRQAVSKWEQGNGYPEVEKLILLSGKLNVSLDSLMSTEIVKESCTDSNNVTGKIIITSPNENVIVTTTKVMSSGKFRGGKNSPQFALFAAAEKTSFWGLATTFIGWYENEEQVLKEISEIHQAIIHGVSTYELKYSVKVERHLWKMVIQDN